MITLPVLPRPTRSQWLALGIVCLLLALSVAVRPINRDEGQYVAATALMRLGLPYADFAYLQTPLQPLLLSPLSLLPAGWLLAASRVLNAAFACASVLLVARTCRGRVSPGLVAIVMLAMICSDPFLYTSALARNDALATLMLAGAVALLVPAAESHRTRASPYFAAGLLLGLAASTKVSFALPAAGAGLYLLLTGSRRHWLSLAFFVLGGISGLLPTLVMAVLEPQRFFFDVFTYSLTAPHQWWAAIGRLEVLSPAFRIERLLNLASHGTILAALLIVLVDRRRHDDTLLLLDLMIVGGVVGAYLPEPSFEQYLAPIIPPLYVRLALALQRFEGALRMVAFGLLSVSALAGLFLTSKFTHKALAEEWQLGNAVRQGRLTAELAEGGRVVTLSPERVAGSNVSLHRGFATGPFLFRTHGNLALQAHRLAFSPNWQRMAELDGDPPAAILTGGEATPRPPLHPRGLDAHLIAWARARGYRPVDLPGRGFVLYVRPRSGAAAGQRE